VFSKSAALDSMFVRANLQIYRSKANIRIIEIAAKIITIVPSVIITFSVVRMNIHPVINQKIDTQTSSARMTSSGTIPLLSYAMYWLVQSTCLCITNRSPKKNVAARRI
jgi:hypothetical protein